jgi:hypothetical protein
MKSKLTIFVLLTFLASFGLAACSAAQPTAAPTATAAPTSAAAQGNGRNIALPIEEKLAAGTLILEGSNAAISVDQAKKLLPLWQQVKTLSADTNTTPEQLQAVYTQIQGVMTYGQMQAINTITAADVQNEMQTLGLITNQAGAGNFGGGANQGQRATRVAEVETATAEGTSEAPGFGFQGTPNPTRVAEVQTQTALGTPPGAGFGFQGTPNPNRTPGAGFGLRGGGLGSLLVQPLIDMLQKKVS